MSKYRSFLCIIFSKVDGFSFFQKIHTSHIILYSLILTELCLLNGQKTVLTVSRCHPSVENLLTPESGTEVRGSAFVNHRNSAKSSNHNPLHLGRKYQKHQFIRIPVPLIQPYCRTVHADVAE